MKSKDCGMLRDELLEYAKSVYRTDAEYPWYKLPTYAVLRHPNGKWYAIIMNVSNEKIGLKGNGRTDVLAAKCDAVTQSFLLTQKGFVPAYHLNKTNWISVLLDGSADKNLVRSLIDTSYEITDSARGHQKSGSVWIVPVKPKYYDIKKAFSQNNEIIWKQSSNILAGDTVFLYITAPTSAIVYECEVLQANIPYHFANDNVHMERVMRIRLRNTLVRPITIELLRQHGVVAVRGPIRMSHSLCCDLIKNEL